MADLFWLAKAQIEQIPRSFPLSHGVPRVDDQRVVSSIIHAIRNGLRWRDAPAGMRPHKTLCNRLIRWSRMGIFNRIFAGLAWRKGQPERLMIDATQRKAHRTAASLLEKGCSPPWRAHQGRPGSKPHMIPDGQGCAPVMPLSEGQMSDHKGAALMRDALPSARVLIADKGHNSHRFRQALAARGIEACMPSRRGRKRRIPHDRKLYRQWHRIENMFGRLKGRGTASDRRIAMRYGRCAHTFMSATCLAATALFRINEV
ncbi:IS5 family transposase [Pseudoroseomonas wenyumeiae]